MVTDILGTIADLITIATPLVALAITKTEAH